MAKLVAITTAVVGSGRGRSVWRDREMASGHSQAQAGALFSSFRLNYRHTADMAVQQVALMRLIDDYCGYHVTRCTDRIIFLLVFRYRSSAMGQYRTDAVDRIPRIPTCIIIILLNVLLNVSIGNVPLQCDSTSRIGSHLASFSLLW